MSEPCLRRLPPIWFPSCLPIFHFLSSIFFLALFWARPAFAFDPSLEISQYAHTAWKVRDGFVPGIILAIAQTPDGYLWLGTDSGLYRFDGVRAVLWQPPAGQQLPSAFVASLLTSHDGTLWIGTDKGLVSWKEGKLTRYNELIGEHIQSLLEDPQGTVWAGEWTTNPNGGKFCAIHHGEVECYGKGGRFGPGAPTFYDDTKGNLWVATGDGGFWRWKPDSPKFYALGPQNTPNSFAEDVDGALLIAVPHAGIKRLVDGRIEETGYPLADLSRGISVRMLWRDQDGALWIGTLGGGLLHVHQGRTDSFAQSDGLSGNTVLALFQDREGTIWVATSDGLDRFRSVAIPTWSAQQSLPVSPGGAVLAARDGSVWMSIVNGLGRLNQSQVTIYRQHAERDTSRAGRVVHQTIDRRLPQAFFALLQDHHGRIWISSLKGGLGYLENEQFHPLQPYGTRVLTSIVEDPAGDLWANGQGDGLLRIHEARTIERIPWDSLGHKDFGWRLAPDPSGGGLWIGFTGGGVAHYKDGRIRQSYSVSDGLGQGRVYDLRFGPRGTLWVATESGLSRIKDGHVATLTSKNGLPCDGVNWTMEDDDHAVWLYTPCGLVRVARSELDAWASDPKRKLQNTVFDASDGVRSMAQSWGFTPQVSKASDGKIWFATWDGVSVIDPRHLPYNTVPPPVHVAQVTADRKTYDAASDGKVRLPPLVRDLQIDYTALSFVVPEKVRFRYKLEGFDGDWQDAGNRRQAFYTNLPPRSYRFLVKASNNSGVWNEEGAVLDFAIAPAYYQTNWFRALCVAAFLALLWMLYQLRLRQVARQFNIRLEERVSERTRIARELHDTLLQSLQGLLLRFQAASNVLPASPQQAKEKLDSAIDQAARAITEGRDAVQGLRASTVERNDLADAIKTLGEGLAADPTNQNPAAFCVAVEGESRNLHPIVRDEVFRIAGEGLRNAFRHANAKRIEVEIGYDQRRLRVSVRDDGKGIDVKSLSADGSEGHYGLRGVRERAKLIGGQLTVWSELDSGTEVELSIPAGRAYATSTRGLRSWFAKKGSRPTVVDE